MCAINIVSGNPAVSTQFLIGVAAWLLTKVYFHAEEVMNWKKKNQQAGKHNKILSKDIKEVKERIRARKTQDVMVAET